MELFFRSTLYLHVMQRDSFNFICSSQDINLLTPNDDYSGRPAPLTSKCCILYIYSTNIGTEYFKRDIYSPFFPLKNAICFINLTYLVPVLFTFYIQDVLKLKKKEFRRQKVNPVYAYIRSESDTKDLPMQNTDTTRQAMCVRRNMATCSQNIRTPSAIPKIWYRITRRQRFGPLVPPTSTLRTKFRVK